MNGECLDYNRHCSWSQGSLIPSSWYSYEGCRWESNICYAGRCRLTEND